MGTRVPFFDPSSIPPPPPHSPTHIPTHTSTHTQEGEHGYAPRQRVYSWNNQTRRRRKRHHWEHLARTIPRHPHQSKGKRHQHDNGKPEQPCRGASRQHTCDDSVVVQLPRRHAGRTDVWRGPQGECHPDRAQPRDKLSRPKGNGCSCARTQGKLNPHHPPPGKPVHPHEKQGRAPLCQGRTRLKGNHKARC